MPRALPSSEVMSTVSPSETSRSVARVIGIGQISPFASVMSSQTLFQSSEPWGPVSGANPPFAIISKSAVWRSFSCRDLSAKGRAQGSDS